MRFLSMTWAMLPAVHAMALRPRLDNGPAQTPPMGWNTYNRYSCSPNESIVHSNAKALVDLGLADLGYRYVTTDCGWTVPDRLGNGSLTWNETMFPSGFPALGQYLHDLGLLFGVYEDAGIYTCNTTTQQAGSLYHEDRDAATFASWNIDALKYDNCYSDAASGYPDVNYAPSVSPRFRYANMTEALSDQSKTVLFQICEWGVDFPALWAPSLGHTWRIGNDIIPAWRAIYRTLNQAVVQTLFAGPGQWPDLDMLEVGNNIFTTPEEQTHFSMWAILKSPLVIGGALKNEWTSISDSSLSILSNPDVVAFNQDSLGRSATLRRRWSEEEYEVWSGPLSGSRTVAALINWADHSRELTLNLPDIGAQYAGRVKDIWTGKRTTGVKTSYTSTVPAHGIMLLEVEDTIQAGVYPTKQFATSRGDTFSFSSIYANTTSTNHSVSIIFDKPTSSPTSITLRSSANQGAHTIRIPASSRSVSSNISLTAGTANDIFIKSSGPISSIQITSPIGSYYPCTSFTLSGSAKLEKCGSGFCQPVGSKIGYIDSSSTAHINIPATVPPSTSGNSTASKYLEIDYINNDIAFSSSWGWGSNSRNLTLSLNGGSPVRLDVPLSGRHSELFGPGLGWWDSSTLGILVDGWKDGDNELIVGNEAAADSFQSYGPDFVGFRFFD